MDEQKRTVSTIRQAVSEDFDFVFPLFQGFRTHSQVDAGDWKKIFSPIWREQKPSFGYVMENDGNAVGFLGTLFSKRTIHSAEKEFCNLTSWIVRPEYRNESLSLLFPLLGQKDLTLTNFTASNRVVEILLKIGFKSLEEHFQMVLPVPTLSSRQKISADPGEIGNRLTGESLRIFQDHKHLHCRHVLLELNGEICYLVLNPARKKNLPVMYVDYIGNLPFFTKSIHKFAFSLCRKLNIYGLMVGEHSLGSKKLPFALRVKRRHALLYRSRDILPADIDTLYSEIQVLGLKPV